MALQIYDKPDIVFEVLEIESCKTVKASIKSILKTIEKLSKKQVKSCEANKKDVVTTDCVMRAAMQIRKILEFIKK